MSEEEHRRIGIELLPDSLGEALAKAEEDPLIREAVSDKAYKKFMKAKMREWLSSMPR